MRIIYSVSILWLSIYQLALFIFIYQFYFYLSVSPSYFYHIALNNKNLTSVFWMNGSNFAVIKQEGRKSTSGKSFTQNVKLLYVLGWNFTQAVLGGGKGDWIQGSPLETKNMWNFPYIRRQKCMYFIAVSAF